MAGRCYDVADDAVVVVVIVVVSVHVKDGTEKLWEKVPVCLRGSAMAG